MNSTSARANLGDSMGAGLARNTAMAASLGIGGVYDFRFLAPPEHLRNEYIDLRDTVFASEAGIPLIRDRGDRLEAIENLRKLKEELGRIELIEWDRDVGHNLVVDVGLNDLLDKYLAGATYTAAWYMGLISSSGWSAIAAGDTMASHAGWTETSAYSQASRPTTAWSAASGKSKSLSSALTFSINAAVTVKGGFLANNATKGGTTGILFSAKLFTGGDKAVDNGDTLSVSYTATGSSS